MNGVSVWQIVREQFWSEAPPVVARAGLQWVQIVWLAISGAFGIGSWLAGADFDATTAVLAANAIFTALGITMAMFFWPRAIDLKNDPQFKLADERWHVYRLTTQLFFTVLVGIVATGVALFAALIPEHWLVLQVVINATAMGLTLYQVLLLAQCVFRLYAATYWMPRA
ncbi:hypothetical protein [Curtobacterium sp. KT1]|jgi:hypothetical protein|uniref:hypothetical protein n=1 Tax=Curtobacterium sp. KT1 TaxID=3372858 RepID=UPI0037C03FF4